VPWRIWRWPGKFCAKMNNISNWPVSRPDAIPG
jgi:hypothetical protein